MSKGILIIGQSGAGKTTSLRNLDPKSTYYFDCDKKGLSWKGWREQYNVENKNYSNITNSGQIEMYIKNIDKNAPHIKTIVIDTLNGIMLSDEMSRINQKGYDKWLDLAHSIWNLIDNIYNYREDLTIICIAHAQVERDENGYEFTRMKTSGKKLDKIVVESKFSTVLLAKVIEGKHVFETKAINSTAKTPFGAFESETVENDIVKVLEILKEY